MSDELPVQSSPLTPQATVAQTDPAAAYLRQTPLAHRRRWGQYVTPAAVARWMVGWTLQGQPTNLLDPAAGTGALLDALLDDPRSTGVTEIVAQEADPAMAAVLRQHLAQRGAGHVTVRLGDFLSDPEARCYDAIVCNPPYVRHRHLRDRQQLYRAFAQRWNVQLSAFSNSYVLFMLAIAERLAPRGRAVILAPADYLNANFGAPIRAALLARNLIEAILVFDQSRLLFNDANIAASLLLLRADRAAGAPIRLVSVADEAALAPLEALPNARLVAPDELAAAGKWLALLPNSSSAAAGANGLVPLGRLATVRRGIATGANAFFVLTEAARARHGLAAPQVRLCIARAAHAPHLHFDREDLAQLLAANRPVWLFDPADATQPAVARYLEAGLRQGIAQRFLPARRTPWYSAERCPVAPLWITAFARTGFRCVLNLAGVAQLTAFHGIYPRDRRRATRLWLAAWLNSSHGAAAIRRECRILGSGLAKLEPRDVEAIDIPDPHRLAPEQRTALLRLYVARCRLERSDPPAARRIAVQIDALWSDWLGTHDSG
ncbi:HsdM family class I SAM-dependent methyltransferase [Kallotenue papyrolyticum]|uniref:HsdM family class I SAM-dependent methyltransferase n=1 Tax=Kallotenue papyrolyticum TaxID=1325125 RepID=UPI00047857B2|nr:N-6 DNA methylase [Kallotenue papyrolyticum]